MTAAKNATQEGIKAAETEAVPPDEDDLNAETEVNFDDVTMQKQLSMGHGRCPHKNQFDLCDKCGDGELKSHEGGIEKGIKQVTRKVARNLEEAAEEERLAERGLRKSVSPLDNLIKALDDVEAQLAVETMDYDGLMKALGSQITQLDSRR